MELQMVYTFREKDPPLSGVRVTSDLVREWPGLERGLSWPARCSVSDTVLAATENIVRAHASAVIGS